MNKKEKDIFYIKKVIELAKKGRYTVHPNPMVGAIIVKNNQIIGKGYHKKPGTPHAEQIAIQQAGHDAKGSTLYVNLEPCCHFGRTPPCSNIIIESKIKRVVICEYDPNPIINGKSIRQLKKAGIIVDIGLYKHEAINLNKGFYSRFNLNAPYVTAKIGMSLDGKTSISNGNSKWITSNESRADVQYERALTPLILSTSNTIIKDNPLLNVRIKSLQKKIINQPSLAIVDSNLRIPLNSRVFSNNSRKIIIFTAKKKIYKKYKPNVEIIIVPNTKNGLNIKSCLKNLALKNYNNIFIESGPKLISSLLKENLIDELILYISPKILGDKATSFSNVSYIKTLSKKIKFNFNDMIQIGNDIKLKLNS